MLRDKKDWITKMIREAEAILPLAYAPYSGFQVAAALLGEGGDRENSSHHLSGKAFDCAKKIYTGCNLENASYPAGICAERTAFSKAVSEGVRIFDGIVILGGPNGNWHQEFCSPCGICRQVMREFSDPGDFEIVLAKGYDKIVVYTLEELLPVSFGPESLK